MNQNQSFYEILQTTAPCVYDEIVFHDNIPDATLFHTCMPEFARLTAMGFCCFFGIPFKEAGIPTMYNGVKCLYEAEAAAHTATRNELDSMRQKHNDLLKEISGMIDQHM